MLQQGKVSLPEAPIVAIDAQGHDMDQSPADLGSFIVPFPCTLEEVGVVGIEACAGASTTPVVDFDLRPTAGSDTSRGAADIGHLVLGTLAAGKMMYDLAAYGTKLYPGQEIVFQLVTRATGTGAAGHVRPYVIVKPADEVKANLNNVVETT